VIGDDKNVPGRGAAKIFSNRARINSKARQAACEGIGSFGDFAAASSGNLQSWEP